MILVLSAATLLAGLTEYWRRGWLGDRPDVACLIVAIYVAAWPVPWTIALLLLFDRRGPVRRWYVARSIAAWGIVTAVAFLMADPLSWLLCRQPTAFFPLLPATALGCLLSLPAARRPTQPGRCIRCGQETVIPAATRSVRPNERIEDGWCARCGADHERVGHGPWTLSPAEEGRVDGVPGE